MTRMKHRRGKAASRFVEKQFFDLRLEYPILTERFSRNSFIVRTMRGIPMHPQSSAMNEKLYPVTESIDEMPRGIWSEAYEIDDDVCVERSDRQPERSITLRRCPIDLNRDDIAPGIGHTIRLSVSA